MAQANIRAVITAEDRASATIAGVGHNANRLGTTLAMWGKRAALAATTAAVAFGTLGVKTAADMESARQGFITLLGSAAKADKTLARIKKEAIRTPFEIAGLTQATQMLTAVTKDGDKAIDVILDVGEGLAAMGRGQAELDRISVNLQQIAASGRAFGIDIKQFAFAGIPIFEMLAEETGKSGEALQDFIEQGGVTFDMLATMFDKANDEGGRFFGAFQNQLGTFNQSWSNMKDTLAITAMEIVKQTGLFDFLKNAMKSVGDWITQNKDAIISGIKNIGAALATVVDVLKALSPAIVDNKAELAIFLGVMGGYGVIVRAAAAVRTFNAALLASPFKLIIVAIAGVVTWFGIMAAAANRVNDRLAGLRNGFQNLVATTLGRIPLIGAAVRNAFITVIEWSNRAAMAINNVINKIPIIGKILPDIPIIQVPGRQHGGPVTAGKPYLVGEAGPEVIVPRQSGSVVPNNQLSSGGNNISLNVNIGMFAGTPMERRKIAEVLFNDLKDIAAKYGMSLSEKVARA